MIQWRITADFRRFRERTAALDRRLGDAVAQTALAIQHDAQGLAPVRTGTLRRSIAAQPVSQHVWLVAVGVHYAKYLEYGTRYLAARPYLTPAVERQRAPFRRRVQAALRGAA